MSEQKKTMQRSGGRMFQAERQQAQHSEVGIFGMFKEQENPE
jgi:hypothetical protein